MTNLIQQSVDTIKNMISVYETNETEINSDIASIESKYKKIVEQESSELKKQLSEVTAQKEIWKQMLSQFATATMEASTEAEVSEPEASASPIEDEDMVVDTFADENTSKDDEDDTNVAEVAAPSSEDEWPTFPEEWN